MGESAGGGILGGGPRVGESWGGPRVGGPRVGGRRVGGRRVGGSVGEDSKRVCKSSLSMWKHIFMQNGPIFLPPTTKYFTFKCEMELKLLLQSPWSSPKLIPLAASLWTGTPFLLHRRPDTRSGSWGAGTSPARGPPPTDPPACTHLLKQTNVENRECGVQQIKESQEPAFIQGLQGR